MLKFKDMMLQWNNKQRNKIQMNDVDLLAYKFNNAIKLVS